MYVYVYVYVYDVYGRAGGRAGGPGITNELITGPSRAPLRTGGAYGTSLLARRTHRRAGGAFGTPPHEPNITGRRRLRDEPPDCGTGLREPPYGPESEALIL